MRYRTTILFLLACVLAAYPAVESNRQTSVCADRFSSGDSGNALTLGSTYGGGCSDLFSQSQTERLMEVLAGFCALGGCISAAKSWSDRQRDRALLRGVRLPLWGRGVPYR